MKQAFVILTRISILVVLACWMIFSFSSCKKDEQVNPVDSIKLPGVNTALLSIAFKNTCNGSDLILDTKNYVNQNGDTFRVSVFNYYISNVVLRKSDGSSYAEPESYHLIKAGKDSTLSFTLGLVPPGTYTSVDFLIGVDSTRNVSGAQTGALDPLQGMFWTWSTGYIMAKMEGVSNSSPAGGGNVAFHIAGFNGKNSAIKPVSVTFPTPVSMELGKLRKLTLRAELDTWFSSPNVIDFSTTPSVVTENSWSVKMAENYRRMISFFSVE